MSKKTLYEELSDTLDLARLYLFAVENHTADDAEKEGAIRNLQAHTTKAAMIETEIKRQLFNEICGGLS